MGKIQLTFFIFFLLLCGAPISLFSETRLPKPLHFFFSERFRMVGGDNAIDPNKIEVG